jgi:CRISPR-associated protein Cas1
MIKRIIHIGNPCYLSSEDEQLLINNKETDSNNKVPIEDIGILILDNPQITVTSGAMQKLLANNSAVILCSPSHLPTGLLLTMEGNFAQTERFIAQTEVKLPLKKTLWQQIIKAKIKNQSQLLKKSGLEYAALKEKIDKVQSGDSTNQEAQASQHYWKNLFPGKKFKRERFGEYPNNLLNYGYSIVRAIVARSIVAVGLHPSIGLHHKNKYNAYCLADDMMEPYRQFVDELIINFFNENPEPQELTKDIKKFLINVAFVDVEIDGTKHPLWVGAQLSCNSLYKCIIKETKTLLLPELC